MFDRSHAPRGNAARDAPRPHQQQNAERPLRHSHAERGNDQLARQIIHSLEHGIQAVTARWR